MSVGETGLGEMGVGETGQIIGETGVGETGVGEMGVIRLNEAVLTCTNDLCFIAKNKKIMYTPVNPSFTI